MLDSSIGYQCVLEYQAFEIVTSQYPSQVGERLRKLFDRADPAYLDRLKSDPRPGVALNAAWGEIRQTLPRGRHDIPLDRDQLRGFLRLVELRACPDVPKWWRQRLLSAQSYSRSQIFFATMNESLYHEPTPGRRTRSSWQS